MSLINFDIQDKILGPTHKWTQAPYFKLLSENSIPVSKAECD